MHHHHHNNYYYADVHRDNNIIIVCNNDNTFVYMMRLSGVLHWEGEPDQPVSVTVSPKFY